MTAILFCSALLKKEIEADTLKPKETHLIFTVFLDQERVSEYSVLLMNIDNEHLGIPVSN